MSVPAGVRRDVGIVVLLALAALGFVALLQPNATSVIRWIGVLLRGAVGGAAVLLPAAAAAAAISMLAFRSLPLTRVRQIGAALCLLDLAGWLTLRVPVANRFGAGNWASGGGITGALVDWIFRILFGGAGLVVALIALAIIALLLAVQFSLRLAIAWPVLRAAHFGRAVGEFVTEPVVEEAAPAADPAPRPLPPVVEVAAPPPPPAMAVAPEVTRPTTEDDDLPDLVGARHSGSRPRADGPLPHYTFPPLDLLRRGGGKPGASPDTAQRTRALEEALHSFGVAARVTDVSQGPAVTRFEVQPGAGVKVARISSLADDIALALAAPDVRIVAPIPGKSVVGIEVPNTVVTPVLLRDVLESSEFRSAASPLTVVLGQDIAGRPVVASLERLLHVLVAGATGSGKSITLNSMLVSLLYKARPDQVKFVLVDPKMVELSGYNGIPHMWSPVITDPKKAAGTLRAVVKEMERRYQAFTAAGARDITRFNQLASERGEERFPFVIVVIDELADLMLVARAEVESAIQRLTQMARAAGIHLIVATQRPSVDVITGVIKANIPSRIALAVSSHIDSRTVLDGSGAEKLVGRGDMLFRPMGAQKLIRVQGAFIAETEVEAVLRFVRKTAEPEYHELIMEGEDDEQGPEAQGEGDDLFVDALQVVVESGQASVSNIQRRLRVGFTRAGRLVDMMEQRGFVGPHQGSKSREVRLSLEQFHQMYGERPSGR